MVRFEIVRSTCAALVVGVILAGASSAASNRPFFENNVDRSGADYSVFAVDVKGVNACYQACAKDKQCLAWTFHRPGTKNKTGECHLKSKVAHGLSNPCCISGVLVGQNTNTGTRLSAPYKAASQGKKGFFRAKLTPGEAVGLPELSVAATTPPLKITPVSFEPSDEF